MNISLKGHNERYGTTTSFYNLKDMDAKIITDDGKEIPLQELIEYVLYLKNKLRITPEGDLYVWSGDDSKTYFEAAE